MYDVYLDYAALLVTILIFLLYSKKRVIRTVRSNVFEALIYVALISNILDILDIHFRGLVAGYSLPLAYVLHITYVIIYNVIPAIYYLYIILLTKDARALSFEERISVLLPISIDVVLLVSTYWTHFVITIQEDGSIVRGKGIILLYLMMLVYVIFGLVVLHRRRRRITSEQRFVILFNIMFAFCFLIIQTIFMPTVILMQFVAAITILVIYISMERPDDFIDKLKGIWNQAAFIESIECRIEQNKSFSLLGIDLIGTEYVGKTQGIVSENNMILQVITFLKTIAEKRELFYIGDAKFVLLADGETVEWQKSICKILERFGSPFKVEKYSYSLATILCIIQYPKDGKDAEELMSNLKYIMQISKNNKASRVVYPTSEMLSRKKREYQIVQAIKVALQEKNYSLYYQPVYSVSEKKFMSAEAIVRLKSDALGYVSAEEFMPIAEQNGFSLEIGEYVFRKVCDFLSKCKEQNKDYCKMIINLNMVQCMQIDLNDTLVKICEEYHVSPSALILKTNESLAVFAEEVFRKNINRLSASGFELALSGFGVGYSNAANIIANPYSYVKLDKSLVWASKENPKALLVLQHLIDILHELGIKTMADGVETAQQASFQKKMGFDYLQGYYYSISVSEEEFRAML